MSDDRMSDDRPVLCWIDLETTGVDPKSCGIVRLAMILTDTELNDVGEPLDITIRQPESVLERMSPSVRDRHTRSGLLDQVRASKVSVENAEQMAMDQLTKHAPVGTARLCGNCVHGDRKFIVDSMPRLHGFLHYRMVDVSTLEQLASWWYDFRYDRPQDVQHTGRSDIRQSIAELKHYREHILRK